jgi:hypothetical protein
MYLNEKMFNYISYVTALTEYFFILYLLIFSYYVRVPLNSGWHTTGGTRTTVWETLA